MKVMRLTVLSAMLLYFSSVGASCAEEKWPGVDEAVVKKIAREHGREARKPLIDTGEGDMQLFMFLSAGTLGGFIAGYYWRVLLEGKKKPGATGEDEQ
jgi:ABC-type cobalt transport system substrate-binding protein